MCRCCVRCWYTWGEKCDVGLPLKKLAILGDMDTATVEQVLGCEMCSEGEASHT